MDDQTLRGKFAIRNRDLMKQQRMLCTVRATSYGTGLHLAHIFHLPVGQVAIPKEDGG